MSGEGDGLSYKLIIRPNGLGRFVYEGGVTDEQFGVVAGFENSFDVVRLTCSEGRLFLKYKLQTDDELFSQINFTLRDGTLYTPACYLGEAVTFTLEEPPVLSEFAGTWTGPCNIDLSLSADVTLVIREDGTGSLTIDLFGSRTVDVTLEILDNELVIVYGREADGSPKTMTADPNGNNMHLPVAPDLLNMGGNTYVGAFLTRQEA